MNNKFKPFFLASFVALSLSGCSHFPGAYTLPIDQGNEFTQSSLDKLKPGMSEEQVRFLLGTPLIKDVFHPERWDYVYYVKKKYKVRENKHVTVFFKNGVVTHYTETSSK